MNIGISVRQKAALERLIRIAQGDTGLDDLGYGKEFRRIVHAWRPALKHG
jgi:hypothetical protein